MEPATASHIHGRTADPGADRPTKIQRILVAISPETPATDVLDLVVDLGRRLDAEVVAFHVRESLLPGSEWVLGEGLFTEGIEEATRLLERVMGRLRAEGIRARPVRRVGRPGEIGRAIVEAARGEQADLIVLGFHRHSLSDRLTGGGIARQVRRLANVPVVTVP